MTDKPAFAVASLDDSLPLWQQSQRGLPNALARSALFNVANLRSGGDRHYFTSATIASSKGINLVYTGQELRQDDEDVFLQVLHLAKEQKLGENISFTAHSMLVALGWTINSESYKRLTICMDRLKATSVRLTVETHGGGSMGFAGSLVGEFEWQEKASNDPLREWNVSLEKNIVKLFAPYSTHRDPFPHKVETLHKLTASGSKGLPQFRQKLKAALAQLVDSGFLLSGRIDAKSDLVHVERAADRRRLE
jgi:hypothetical protein